MTAVTAKEQKRRVIMAAAAQVFSQKGYHYSKMEEIAGVAGIGKGTIYEYFPSKLQLLQEIMEQSFHVYDDTIAGELEKYLSWEERIKILVQGHLSFCLNNREFARIIFRETNIIDEEIKEWADRNRRFKEEYLQSLIEQAIDNEEIRQVDGKMLATMISGILVSFWAPVVTEGWNVDAEATARQVTDIIMRGIEK